MMTATRERAQAYLELASKAAEGPWSIEYPQYNQDAPLEIVDNRGETVISEGFEPDVSFIVSSRTEGVWAAQKLLEAADLFERIIELDERAEDIGEASECLRMVAFMARDFLEGGER